MVFQKATDANHAEFGGATFSSPRLKEVPRLKNEPMKTDRTPTLPPFFTQVIGSLPRPKLVLDLLARRSEMSADRYARVMDDMVVFAIRPLLLPFPSPRVLAALDNAKDRDETKPNLGRQFQRHGGLFALRGSETTETEVTMATDKAVPCRPSDGQVKGPDQSCPSFDRRRRASNLSFSPSRALRTASVRSVMLRSYVARSTGKGVPSLPPWACE